jgi:hypothetical protein
VAERVASEVAVVGGSVNSHTERLQQDTPLLTGHTAVYAGVSDAVAQEE